MNEKINRLVNEVAEPESINRLSVEQIHQWLSDYLEMREEDNKRFPEQAESVHADILMADFDPNRLALFIVANFVSDQVTIAAGRGVASNVRMFLERDFPTDASQIIEQLKSRFILGEMRISVSYQDLAAWLRNARR